MRCRISLNFPTFIARSPADPDEEELEEPLVVPLHSDGLSNIVRGNSATQGQQTIDTQDANGDVPDRTEIGADGNGHALSDDVADDRGESERGNGEGGVLMSLPRSRPYVLSRYSRLRWVAASKLRTPIYYIDTI